MWRGVSVDWLVYNKEGRTQHLTDKSGTESAATALCAECYNTDVIFFLSVFIDQNNRTIT